MYIDQIEASTSPPGISRAFDTFVVPVGREFDNQRLLPIMPNRPVRDKWELHKKGLYALDKSTTPHWEVA